MPVAVHGGDRRSTAQNAVKAIKPPDQGANSNLKKRGSGDADYLAARIKRDRPDIAARVEKGESETKHAMGIG